MCVCVCVLLQPVKHVGALVGLISLESHPFGTSLPQLVSLGWAQSVVWHGVCGSVENRLCLASEFVPRSRMQKKKKKKNGKTLLV